MAAVGRAVRRSLWDKVPRDHRESPRALRRRQWVTGAFVVIGAVVLGFSLSISPGNAWFYPATLGLAAVWAIGAFASGPLHLGRTLSGDEPGPRPLLMPSVYGVLLAALFVVGGLVVREVPVAGRPGAARPRPRPAGVGAAAGGDHRPQRRGRGAVLPRCALRRDHPLPGRGHHGRLRCRDPGHRQPDAGLRRACCSGCCAASSAVPPAASWPRSITHVVWSTAMLFALPALFG